ncbi:hypothetical protein [Halobacteriovorax sp. JY17]|uniref:hypothetical protein n=1 Tax=Halobacteriovorax sp. JY17 TaxID=2014617 RepID=UPI000C6379AC|nr:hypothetical protein [Halobacteriovorax sp. JY17]PIK13656.1 MAG: hypothetical protein CES88_15815 [Halobacteriovorax sp. JY17]
MDQNYWRKCIVCKKEINFSTKYYKCSVTSCDKKRAPAQFCSVDCWGVHSSTLNHKSAWAEEFHSPSKSEWQSAPKVRIVTGKSSSSDSNSSNENLPNDILVVVSKMKAYVKAKGDLNTSADVSDALSDIIRHECDKAIERARADGRKTLMGKDF